MASKTVTRCIYKDLYGKPYKLDWVAKVVFLIQMPLTFGGRCNHYLWDIRLKIHRSPKFREQSLTIGWGGGEGWYYLKNAGPKILAPLRLTAQNPAPSKNVCPQNCNPPLTTFWVFECYMVRIHISVTLRQLFHWNKKVLLFTIFSGVEAESLIWILIFMIPVVFYLNDSWFSSRFTIHEDSWSPIHLMMFSLAT